MKKATVVTHEVRKEDREESVLKDLVKSDSELFPSENGG